MLLFQIFQKAYFEQKKQYNLFSSLFSLYHTNHFFTVIYIDIKFTSNGKNIKPYLYFFHVRMCTVCEFGCLWPFERLTSDMSAVWWICHINSSFCLCVWVFVTPEDKVFHARLFHYLRSALLLTKWEKCVHACVSVCVWAINCTVQVWRATVTVAGLNQELSTAGLGSWEFTLTSRTQEGPNNLKPLPFTGNCLGMSRQVHT